MATMSEPSALAVGRSERDLPDRLACSAGTSRDVGLCLAPGQLYQDARVQGCAAVLGAGLVSVCLPAEPFEFVHGNSLADMPRGLTNSQGGRHTLDMTTTQTPTIADMIDDHRNAEAALRGIARNGGRIRATTNAVDRHSRIAADALRALLLAGQKALVGMLTEEAKLAERLAGGVARPELKGRLDVIRMDIRRFRSLIGDRGLASEIRDFAALKPGTHDWYMAEMTNLAEYLDAVGNTEGAAAVRNDIRMLSTPRAQAQLHCDACTTVVRSVRQINKYDQLGVDWLLCTKCETP